MKVSGIEMITLPTQKAARNLTIISSTIFAINFFQIDLETLSILGVKDFGASMFDTVSYAILIFLIISLIVHWLTDWVTYTKWYDTNQVSSGYFEDFDNLQSSPELIESYLNRHSDDLNANGITIASLKSEFEEIRRKEEQIKKLLAKQGSDFATVNYVVKVYVIGWYLILPNLFALLAFGTFCVT